MVDCVHHARSMLDVLRVFVLHRINISFCCCVTLLCCNVFLLFSDILEYFCGYYLRPSSCCTGWWGSFLLVRYGWCVFVINLFGWIVCFEGLLVAYFNCDLCFVLICLARLSSLEKFLWHFGHLNRAVWKCARPCLERVSLLLNFLSHLSKLHLKVLVLVCFIMCFLR